MTTETSAVSGSLACDRGWDEFTTRHDHFFIASPTNSNNALVPGLSGTPRSALILLWLDSRAPPLLLQEPVGHVPVELVPGGLDRADVLFGPVLHPGQGIGVLEAVPIRVHHTGQAVADSPVDLGPRRGERQLHARGGHRELAILGGQIALAPWIHEHPVVVPAVAGPDDQVELVVGQEPVDVPGIVRVARRPPDFTAKSCPAFFSPNSSRSRVHSVT
jgi:hypothetical protein